MLCLQRRPSVKFVRGRETRAQRSMFTALVGRPAHSARFGLSCLVEWQGGFVVVEPLLQLLETLFELLHSFPE